MKELVSYISSNNLQNYVIFTGEQNDVSSLLKNMDVGLMSSRNEAFGRVTVEYMMHNLAVIASSTGANPEIIKHGINGFVYELGDYVSLANCMKAMVMDKSLILKFSEEGRTIALNRFTSRRNSSSIYSLYQNLINKKQ